MLFSSDKNCIESFFKKNSKIFSSAVILAFLVSSTSFAQTEAAVKTEVKLPEAVGLHLENDGVEFEGFVGVVNTDEEADAAIESITAQIKSRQAKNPKLEIHLGEMEEAVSRNPSGDGVSKTRRFIQNLAKKLLGSSYTPAAYIGYRLSQASEKSLRQHFAEWYVNNNRVTWTFTRVSTISGFEWIGMEVSKVAPAMAFESIGVIAGACLVTAVKNIPINNFQNHSRIYNTGFYKSYVKSHPNSWLAQRVAGLNEAGEIETRAKWVDPVHGKSNFFIVEGAFGLGISEGLKGVQLINGVTPDSMDWWRFFGNTGLSTLSQGQWEEALGKWRDLNLVKFRSSYGLKKGNAVDDEVLKQIQKVLSEGVFSYSKPAVEQFKVDMISLGWKETVVNQMLRDMKLINAAQSGLSAFGSFLSVLGYTLTNMPGPKGEITLLQGTGYGLLASLGAAGFVFKKHLQKKEILLVQAALEEGTCNAQLNPNSKFHDLDVAIPDTQQELPFDTEGGLDWLTLQSEFQPA